MMQQEFGKIVTLIKQSQLKATRAVNTELVNLYWQVGEYISKQVAKAVWGDKTIDELAAFIAKHHPELKGFNRRGLYRMKQFYETYSNSSIVSTVLTQLQSAENQGVKIVSPLDTQFKKAETNTNEIVSTLSTQFNISDIRSTKLVKLSWSHHLSIMARTKTEEERVFYINLCNRENYSVRELDRQISSSIFERVMIGNAKLPTQLKETYPEIINHFKDSYVFEFLNLPEPHSETDLKKGLISQMKKFLLELGKDFLFAGEEYSVQVGNRDFFIDLLFYHRGLQCLVAIEIKTDRFEPEYLGKLNLYLEALDRDVKKPNENPSIGILLCKDRDATLVEYALSRNMSPTLIAEYNTLLPEKKLLIQKLSELFENNSPTT